MNGWYTAAEEPELVEFDPVRGLNVSGTGAPGGPEYGVSVRALYGVAGRLGPPGALEGRWWVETGGPPLEVPREQWRWHLFLRLPDEVEPAAVERAREAARAQSLPEAARVLLVTFAEGPCVQALHRGAYADEPRTLAAMDALCRREGLVPNGLHHELYLSDHRETDPRRMRTILRQPVRAAG
jgi:hypothetical protein